MPKHLITVIGLIVSLGIVALAVVLVALPMWVQSLSVDAQTTEVENTNQLYQAQVTALETEEERLDEIEASVVALRTEIPAVNQLDDVFELISRAADSAGVTITSATAGANAAFVTRTTPSVPGDPASAPTPPAEPEADSGEGAADSGTAETPQSDSGEAQGGSASPSDVTTLEGRQQIDFEIAIKANEMDQVTKFLDGLRAGPRLLSSITATATQTGTAIEVQIKALTFIDSEG
ncbi:MULTISPECIES: hypothetical protein [Microbacterium]|uniref:hypothetical protein n=1 Tax=Microbacterium TaxID=33882 RepID=UPI00146CE5D7|nr:MULTISPECIES: hypothetical protein [Microbacterium]